VPSGTVAGAASVDAVWSLPLAAWEGIDRYSWGRRRARAQTRRSLWTANGPRVGRDGSRLTNALHPPGQSNTATRSDGVISRRGRAVDAGREGHPATTGRAGREPGRAGHSIPWVAAGEDSLAPGAPLPGRRSRTNGSDTIDTPRAAPQQHHSGHPIGMGPTPTPELGRACARPQSEPRGKARSQ